MAIDKKLIHFKQWSTFISSQGVNGNYTTPSSGTAGSGSALYGQIKETSIVFIQDVQKIWTHGKLYECSAPDLSKYLTAEDLSDLNSFVEKCSVTKTGNGNGETLTVTVGDSSNSITNTWRTVQVNGSSISNNTLNLKAGTNITLSKSNGEVTITGASFPTSLPANGGTADKANTLTDARTIDGVDFNGSANITHYGTCGTAAGTAAKTVSLTGYKLATGAKVAVKFTVTNTAANPTLNVNSTGAKAIYYRGAAISKGYLAANRVYEFVYDGTHYELIGDINTDTDTDTKVTSEANHYTPTATAADLSADAAAGTASWNVPVVTGVNLQRDSKGHIVGITVDSVNTPAKPADNNTAHSHSVGTGLSSSGSGGTSGTTTYSLKTAATDEIGGVKVGKDNSSYAVTTNTSNISADVTSGKYYAVEIDKDDKAFVYVPWTDNNTDTKVTSAANHYTPSEDTNSAISASGGSATNITGTSGKLNVVTGLKRDAKGHIVGVTSANIYSTDVDTNTAHAHSVGTGLTISGSGGTSGTVTYAAKLKDNTALTVDSAAATTTSGRVYPVAVDKSGYLSVNVPWTDNNTTSFAITANASDDDVIVLSGTNGTNAVSYSATHAKKFSTSGATYTSGNATTSISGYGASATIKIPQLTVDSYGHVTAAADESVTITMPSAQTIPTLSGGSAAESGKYVSGVTVSGHTVTVAKGTLPTIPTALKNPNALTFGSKTYDGSAAKTITAADLGLGTALKFHGTSKTAITDGSTTQTVTLSNNSSHTAENGCVLFYGNKEFVWNGSSWEELGNEGNYKVKQTAVSSPTASGNTTAFIDTISQNENGVISATKKYITNNVTYTGTLVDEQVAVFEGTSGQVKASGYTIAKSVPSDAKFTDTNTHYTSKNIVGASSTATANAVASNGSVWLNHLEESTVKSSHNIVGAGSVTVASDANGKITITGTDTNTDTKVTSVGNHYSPSANSSAELTAAISGTAGAYAKDTEYTVLTGVKAQRDAKGHVVGLTYTAQKIKDTNTDTNTHWTTRLYAGASGTAANAAASNPYLKVTDDNTYRNQVQFAGAGTVSVASDAAGKITITGSAHPTSLPASDVYAWAKKPALALADVPNLSTKYLPLSGGTITSSSQYALRINSSHASPYATFIQMLNSSMSTTNNTCNIAFGYQSSAKNLGYIGFKYKGTDSTSNMLTMGLHSVDNVINVLGTGNVGIGTESPAAKLDVVGDIKTSGSVKIQSVSITYDSTQKCIKFTF